MARFTPLSLSAWLAGVLALGGAVPAAAQGANASLMVSEVIVTAQRRAEASQDVPIALTALNDDELTLRGIDGADDLLHAIPNVSFSKRPFTDYNFQIRGIGSKVIGASGDPGVGVHLNNAPMITNRLFEAEFYDMERVEVLRGPQGTLYGRNATGGVVNLITAKPVLGRFEGQARVEAGDYGTRKVRGMANLPLGDTAALRVAGTLLKRDGFGHNLTLGTKIDDRDLHAWRATLAFEPTPGLRVRGYYEHFNEDDRRGRVGKQLCAKDLGPGSVGGVAVLNPVARGLQSQGCRNVSAYDPAALGTINTMATLTGAFGLLNGVLLTDGYAGRVQSSDLRDLESAFNPIYRAKEDVYQLSLELDVTEHATLSLLTSHAEDSYFTFQDYNRVSAATPFTAPAPLAGLFQNGNFFNDPQVGLANTLRAFDISQARSSITSHELRLQSDTGGRLDVNVGALYLDYAIDQDYFIMSNMLTLSALTNNPIAGRYVDTSAIPTGEGHNYFLTRTPYRLRSYAAFGELYWRLTDRLKLTIGGRYNHDRKRQRLLPAQLTVAGQGYPATAQGAVAHFKESTGRIGLDWKPDVAFTDQTLLYGFVSRGYKPGGFNPPCSAGVNCPMSTYAPEFVVAFEAGAKNRLMGGRLELNLSAFAYDYDGYQVSKTVNRTVVSENINANILGFEGEAVWAPTTALRFNASLGLLKTRIGHATSIDSLDRTQGDAALSVLSGALVGGNCVVPTRQLAAFNAVANNNPSAARLLLTACGGSLRTGTTAATGNPLAPAGVFLDPSDGVAVDLNGKRLPNAPTANFNLGAQYTAVLGDGWTATARVDYWRQTASYARIYNSVADRIRGYQNLNVIARVARPDLGLTLEAYVKNLTNETAITDIQLTDDSSGLFRNIFLTEPRITGVALTKTF